MRSKSSAARPLGSWLRRAIACVLCAVLIAGALPAGANTLEIDPAGVAGVVAGETAEVEYFNLQGIRVQTPAKGATYIKRQGSAVSKVIF